MPPRPCYRMKSFWLGLIGLAFLFHAWFASSQRATGVHWIHGMTHGIICSSEGDLFIRKEESLSGEAPGSPGFLAFSDPHGPEVKTGLQWSPPVSLKQEEHPRLYRSSHAAIAHWLIILLYLIAWLTTITWRHRRQRGLLESHDSPPPAASTSS